MFSSLVIFISKTFAQQCQNPPCVTIGLSNPIGSGTIADVVTKIVDGLRDYIAPPIVAAMILFAAFQILTAGGNEEKFKKGKKTLLYAVIGYAIIIISSGIIYLIEDVLGAPHTGQPATGVSTLSGAAAIISDVVKIFINIFWAIAVAFALWTSLTFMSAGGDETKIKTVKKRLLYTIIAFVIAISINVLQELIKHTLGVS
ncbi:hypothetical protein COZ81_00735 [Candidatus Jorgensenbacteria bacterium CG_4_8_14_3_um_filter_38_10]|nr:MAG: hypothetical protein COZ81_00735 [Candidatus Jorgensenbacteria bacterium CG_4_8_14_3_um_filter_38_10]PJA95088.1 MAG: hypothetical protein CO130_01105 [Candidatus Jorgensenbacteria bacterium CG_4_9_14_3_um_filter_38_10]